MMNSPKPASQCCIANQAGLARLPILLAALETNTEKTGPGTLEALASFASDSSNSIRAAQKLSFAVADFNGLANQKPSKSNHFPLSGSAAHAAAAANCAAASNTSATALAALTATTTGARRAPLAVTGVETAEDIAL